MAAPQMRGNRSGSQASVDTYGGSHAAGTVADLTACVRRTKGQVPPPLVGASITVLGSMLYVFGGRLVPTRSMISDLYALDLHTFVWERIWPARSAKGKERAKDVEEADEGGPSDSTAPAQDTPSEAAQRAEGPLPRYFHSAEAWGNDKLIFFGGMGFQSPDGAPPEESPSTPATPDNGLRVLGDVLVFDVNTREWSFPQPTCDEGINPPAPRYAHLCSLNIQTASAGLPIDSSYAKRKGSVAGLSHYGSSVTDTSGRSSTEITAESSENSFAPSAAMALWPKGRTLLALMGGQDIQNQYIHELNVLDLDAMRWVEHRAFPQNCGTYRSVACARSWTVREGDELDAPPFPIGAQGEDNLRRTSWSEQPSVEQPEPIYIYSNFNFSDVKRDLELVSFPPTPPHEASPRASGHVTTIHPLSQAMTGPPLPPGLRFPTGCVIGNHLIISGTLLSQTTQCFAIWALELSSSHSEIPYRVPPGKKVSGGPELTWQKVDPGTVTSQGSWNRAAGWRNSLVVIGDRDRDISEDYHHRQLNFKHIAFIDLEAFGIYQPPPQPLPLSASQLGLQLFYTPALADFELVCSDGQAIACNRKMLEDCWPWFNKEMKAYREKARNAFLAFRKGELENRNNGTHEEGITDGPQTPTPERQLDSSLGTATAAAALSLEEEVPPASDIRFTPRKLEMPHHPVLVLAFMEWIHARQLCTPLHRDTQTLSALLVFATSYEVEELRAATVHALHRALGKSAFKVGNTVTATIYEAAALSGCLALQIRCLKAFYHVKHLRERMIYQQEAVNKLKTQSIITPR